MFAKGLARGGGVDDGEAVGAHPARKEGLELELEVEQGRVRHAGLDPRGADGAVRFGGVGLEEMKLGAQELGLGIGQQQEVVQIGERCDVVEQQGGLAPKLVRGA